DRGHGKPHSATPWGTHGLAGTGTVDLRGHTDRGDLHRSGDPALLTHPGGQGRAFGGVLDRTGKPRPRAAAAVRRPLGPTLPRRTTSEGRGLGRRTAAIRPRAAGRDRQGRERARSRRHASTTPVGSRSG